MIGVASSAIIGMLLLLLLLMVWRKAVVSARELPSQWELLRYDEGQREACPPEMVSKIFSIEDQEFVSSLQCDFLGRLFRAERKSLALLWVQQTSQGIQKIMREHTELTRRSADLEFRTEMRIFLRYAELRMVCALLLISIELAGPLWLRGLAIYANKVSEQLGQTHEAFLAAADAKGIRGVDSY